MTTARQSVLIAGAGAFGSAIAFELARAGHPVTVVDPGPPNASASAVAAGMLAPAFESVMDAASAAHWPLLSMARDLWPAFANAAGISLDRSGAMAVGTPEDLQAWSQAFDARQIAHLVLDPDDAQGLAPQLAPGRGGVMTLEDWRLDPADALAALRAGAVAAGATWLEGTVTAFQAGRAQLDDGRTLDANVLIVATGAGQALLAPEVAALTPVKGEILTFPDQRRPGPVIRGQGIYLTPSAGGLRVGATMEVGRRDLTLEPEVAARLRAEAEALVPELVGVRAVAAAGIRAATADGLPMIGGSRTPGVLIATGARRNGWLLAPLAARIIAGTLAGAEPDAVSRRLDPGRLRVP